MLTPEICAHHLASGLADAVEFLARRPRLDDVHPEGDERVDVNVGIRESDVRAITSSDR
jgi:hypothetical protein